MRWLRVALHWLFIVAVYAATFTYVAWRVFMDRAFWRSFLRART